MKIPVESMDYSYFSGKPGGITRLTTEKGSNIRMLSMLGDVAHLADIK